MGCSTKSVARRGAVPLLLVCAGAFVTPRRSLLAPAARGGTAHPLTVRMICPLVPLAPVWLAGKAVIEARRSFFPEAEPWPRAWEESDLWLDKSLNFAKYRGDEPKCPVPAEERKAGGRRPEPFDPVDVLGEPKNAGEYLAQYALLGGIATVLAGGSLFVFLGLVGDGA